MGSNKGHDQKKVWDSLSEEQKQKGKDARAAGRKKNSEVQSRRAHLEKLDEVSKEHPRVTRDGYDWDAIPDSDEGWEVFIDGFAESVRRLEQGKPQKSRRKKS